MFFSYKTPIDNINIAILGCVSAGKSTILNAMFCQDFSECKIKRTTMMPTVFVETKTPQNILTPEEINKIISEKNKEIIGDPKNPKPFNLIDHGIEMIFEVDKLDIQISFFHNVTIFDIPGLNDSLTKFHYYEYLEDNFEKFNIIMFIVNIESGLNTSDEMDIIKFIAENIKKQKINKKDIKLLVVANKSDEMQMQDGEPFPQIIDEELNEMFNQIQALVELELHKFQVSDSLIGIVPVCGIDAHVYRMINKKRNDYKLTPAQTSRIGIREKGNSFRRMKQHEQNEVIQAIISNKDTVTNAITLSGFSRIDHLLFNCINKSSYAFISSNIEQSLAKTQEITLQNLVPVLIQKLKILAKIKNINPQLYHVNMEDICEKIHGIINSIISKIIDLNAIIDTYIRIRRLILYDKTNIIIPDNSQNLSIVVLSQSVVNTIGDMVFGFWDNKFPKYLIHRIKLLVTNDFTETNIPISKLKNFEIIERIRCLKKPNIEMLLSGLLDNFNVKYKAKYNFSEETDELCINIINIFDKLKIASNFIKFLRSFLICRFHTKSLETLQKLSMLYKKYREIPLHEYIITKLLKPNDMDIDINVYLSGITHDFDNDKEFIFDKYYLNYAKDIDPLNFYR
jgi:predicted GTPase